MKILLNNRSPVLPIVLGCGLLGFSQHLTGDGPQTPRQTIEFYYGKLVEQYQSNGDGSNEAITNTLEALFDFENLAGQILQQKWTEMPSLQQKRFIKALSISLEQKIQSEITSNGNRVPQLKIHTVETEGKSATLSFSIVGSSRKDLSAHMLKYPDGKWRLNNVKYKNKSLRREYYSKCKDILDKYSVAYLIAELTNNDVVILEDFEDGEVGQLPPGWSWRDRDNHKNKPYRIKQENGNKYLAAEDNGESVILAKDVKWDLKKYPYLSFKWRAHKLPKGGDERYGRTVDSAAGIYIVYKKKFGLIPESVKYVWSTTLPVGAYMRRSGTGRPWMVVAESGTDHLGEWRTYVFNVYEAYEKTHGGSPPDHPVGIGILSDANSTASQAYADYDDIIALKHADAGSGVEIFMKAE